MNNEKQKYNPDEALFALFNAKKPDDDDLFIMYRIRLTESEFILLENLSIKTGKTKSEIMRTALKYYSTEVI